VDVNLMLKHHVDVTFFHFKRFSVIFYDPIKNSLVPYFMHEIPNFTMHDLRNTLKYDGRDLKLYFNRLRIAERIYLKPPRLQ